MDSLDAGVGGCFAGILQIRTPRGRLFMLKRFKMDQHRAKRAAKGSQGTFENTTCGTGSKSEENGETQHLFMGVIFDKHRYNSNSKNHKNTIATNMELYSKVVLK